MIEEPPWNLLIPDPCRQEQLSLNLIRFAGVVWEGLGDGSLRMEQGFLRSGWPPAPARRVGLGLIGLGWDGVGLGWGGGCFTDSSWL